VEQGLQLKIIPAAFDRDKSAYERVLSPEFCIFRKAVVDPAPRDVNPIRQNWGDSKNAALMLVPITRALSSYDFCDLET